MYIFNKHFQDIDINDLEQLITEQVPEGKTIDYKLLLPTNTDGDKKELLYDVTSFANTSGGYLIFGIGEANGIPTDIVSLEGIDPDAEIRRLEATLLSAIQPRIHGLLIRAIQTASGHVIAIHIPKSWIAPHMVTFQNLQKFYSRNSAGKYMLDVQQLKTAFVESELAHEKIREFRFDRINNITSEETPIPLENGAKIILHLVPIAFLQSSIDVYQPLEDGRIPAPISNVGWDNRLNFDGLVSFWQPNHTPLKASYVQLFRNGCVEAVDSYSIRNAESIRLTDIEQKLLRAVSTYLQLLERLSVELPLALMLSITGVKGFHAHGGVFMNEKDNLILQPIFIDNYSVEIEQILRPLFNNLWNAFGRRESPNYNEAGKWLARLN